MSKNSNTVELVGTYGSDITHSLSAWTSTNRDLDTVDKKGVSKRERIGPLLKMLAENGHHTPFEKSALHFLVKTDIASHIHLLKHRVGVSINGESARYKELKEDKLYIPADWPDVEKKLYENHMKTVYENYHNSLEKLFEYYISIGEIKSYARKRAKESARFYLPYGNQITCDVQFNFRSFSHFIKLRYSKHAQLEIRDVAMKMLTLVKNTGDFNLTLKAFELIDSSCNIMDPL